MEGYRTYIVGAVMLLIAAINNQWPGVVPLGEAEVNSLLSILTPILMLIMRKATKQPAAL